MTVSLISMITKFQVSTTVKNVLGDTGRSAVSVVGFTIQPSLVDGVSANQANRAQEIAGTLVSGGTLVIDLYDWAGIDNGAGAGNDPVGQALIMEEVVLIVVYNESDTTGGDLAVAPDASNGWAGIGTHSGAGILKPGAFLIKGNPHTDAFDVVDASSHRIILTASGGADVDYRVLVLGRHDDDESSSSSSSSSSNSSSSSSSSSQSSSSSSSNSSSSSSSSSSNSSSHSISSSSTS